MSGATIDSEVLILVEGKDEINFFNALLKHMGITSFEVIQSGGKERFRTLFPGIVKTTGFKQKVKKLLIVQDADQNEAASFESIVSLVRREKLISPPKVNEFSKGSPSVCIFLMPGNSETGMLEDLCLKTVETKPGMRCVKTFVECVSAFDEGQKPRNMAKAKAQVYLATLPKIQNSVGIAALKSTWDFDSPELDEIKSVINLI